MKMRKSLRKRLSLRKLGSFRRKKSDVDEQDYLEAFQNYDIDNSGSVDKMELYIVMKSLGYTLTEKQLLNMMNAVDTDSSGEKHHAAPSLFPSTDLELSHGPDPFRRNLLQGVCGHAQEDRVGDRL